MNYLLVVTDFVAIFSATDIKLAIIFHPYIDQCAIHYFTLAAKDPRKLRSTSPGYISPPSLSIYFVPDLSLENLVTSLKVVGQGHLRDRGSIMGHQTWNYTPDHIIPVE